MQSNSQSQPTPRVGNQSGRRRDVIPDITGSREPAPRVGNLNGRRRDVVRANMGSGSGTQQNEPGSSHSAPRNSRLSSRNSSPPPIGGVPRGRPSKRPRRSTIQTTEDTEPETEPDGQRHIEAVPLSDDSSDEYQASCQGDETEPHTEPDIEELDSADGTPSGRRRESQAAERQGSNRLLTVRISTTSGSQEAALVRRTPVGRVRITPGRAFTPPPMFPSSSVGLYSSSLALPSDTASGIRSSSPPLGDPSTPLPGRVPRGINSRRNTVTGIEGEIVGVGMYLMILYALFKEPLADPAGLTAVVHRVWSHAQDEIADAGNIEPSEKALDIVSGVLRCDKILVFY